MEEYLSKRWKDLERLALWSKWAKGCCWCRNCIEYEVRYRHNQVTI